MKKHTLSTLLLATSMLSACSVRAEPPAEWGDVAWKRDAATAQADAKRTGRPILLLFTEVPGCSTVNRYATDVLRNPVIAEAAETLFVPLVVHNNLPAGTPDHALLTRFHEPAWNNPVLHVVDADLQPLASRLAGDYTVAGTAATMVAGLEKAGGDAPPWLTALTARADEVAVFGMYCFWSGEVALGAQEGVVSTEPGFLNGGEVVRVRLDPRRTTARQLAARAHVDLVSADAGEVKPTAKDRNYQLRRSKLADLSLDATQQTRVNAALGQGGDPTRWLTPRQIARLGAGR